MFLYGPVTLLLLVLTTGSADSKSCFQCTKESDLSKCTSKVNCGSDETCQDIVNVGRRRRSNELRIQRSDITACSRCCSTDQCNKDLCVKPKPTQATPATSNLYVRLINGRNAYEGTVEVYHNKRWGSVCDDGWTSNDAKVVCRMLGYSTQGAGATQGGSFRSSKSLIWLDTVTCSGSEKSLSNCSHDDWAVTDCAHNEDAGVICPAVSPEDDVIFLLDIGLGGVIFRMNLKTQSFAPVPINNIYTPSSFDYDQSQGRLYFVDAKLKQIVSIRFDGTDARNIRQLDFNADLEKIEVDPLNHILFYTDTGNDIIASLKTDGSDYKILINTSLDQPRDIVMDPRTKTIYWTDWGTQPKIEMANYDGSSRRTLVSQGIRWPNGLAIDYSSNTLFFVDGGMGKIEALGLKGNNRRLIYSETGAHFYALDVFQDYLYYTDWTKNTVMRVKNDGTGNTHVGPVSFRQLSDLRVHEYGADLPGVTTPSPVHFDPSHVFVRLSGKGDSNEGRVEVYANGQWGTICDDGWDQSEANVVCGMLGLSSTGATATSSAQEGSGSGLILLSNLRCKGSETSIAQCGITVDDWGKHSCSHNEDAGVICKESSNPDSFLIFSEAYSGYLIRMSLQTFSYTVIPVRSSPNPVAVAYDTMNHKIYFSEVTQITSEIRTSDLLGKTISSIATKPGSTIDGLAVDTTKNILFYTDAGTSAIMSMTPDGTNVKTVATNVEKPRALALDKASGVLYWTDWGSNPKIEKANYDGTNRQVLANTSLLYPNGIAVDPTTDEVFFCDAGTKRIEKIKGDTRTLLYEDQAAHFFGLTLTKQHLYFSDWKRRGIVRLNRDGSGMFPAGPSSFTRVNSLFAYQSGFS